MESNFIPYEQALSLKELGFDEKSLAYWFNETPLNPEGQCLVYYRKPYDNVGITSGIIREYGWAPLYQQAFKWFREKYDLEGVVQQANDYTWYKFSIYQKSNFYTSEGKVLKSQGLEYETHEEAEQACLDKLIEICKTK